MGLSNAKDMGDGVGKGGSQRVEEAVNETRSSVTPLSASEFAFLTGADDLTTWLFLDLY